ncbi:glycogen/starch synthase [Dyella sp. LX-66]|uniref:glycogen/starch synthase n=1 Tax=unclassified Dyella TaxID=2634549 RepID=UPI001BDFF940|nr:MULTISPECIES: alpha-amylase family glycosyl hydrolase [unclassified Dyella]MBT2118871.1 glycogen/starch synthase [Dyella sp. LX-1]MBT2140136.1 glycogen/starch synthase [Dyella sp. LX-66]
MRLITSSRPVDALPASSTRNDFGRSYSIFTKQLGSGDFRAISNQVDALHRLGIGKLHLSPVYPQSCQRYNATHNDHQYWPSDHTSIDDGLGGEQAFLDLLETLRRHSIDIVLDLILTHFGYGGGDAQILDRHDLRRPECYRIDLNPPEHLYTEVEQASSYRVQLSLRDEIAKYAIYNMPSFDHSDSAARRYIIDAHKRFIAMGVRAFRIDSARHIPLDFLADFIAELANGAPGENVSFLLEEAGTRYTSIACTYYETLHRIPDNARVYFLDFPLNGAVLALQDAAISFKRFVRFIHDRETPLTPLERLIPFVESHDSTALPADRFWALAMSVVTHFFSSCAPMLFHGGEAFMDRKQAREHIDAIAPSGVINDLIGTMESILDPYRASANFGDTKEYCVTDDTLLAAKSADGRRLFLFISRSEDRIDLAFYFGASLRNAGMHTAVSLGEKCAIDCRDDVLRIVCDGPACAVFELIEAQAHADDPAHPVNLGIWADMLHAPRNSRHKVLMAAMEFGHIEGLHGPDGEPIDVRMGGLGQVISEIVRDYPDFLSKDDGECFFAFPLYSGIPRESLSHVASFDIEVEGRIETMQVYGLPALPRPRIYFLAHPHFLRRSAIAGTGARNVYHTDGYRDEMIFLRLFNRGLAHLFDRLQCTVYHGHDYHTSLVPFFLDRNATCTLSIHNAGAAYVSSMTLPYYGGLDRSSEAFQETSVSIEEFSRILGIDLCLAIEHFQHKGAINILKGATSFVAAHNLVGGLPVSAAYARELSRSWGEVMNRVAQAHGKMARDPFNLLVPSGHVRYPLLYGINNGSAFDGEGLPADADEATGAAIKRAAKAELLKHLWPGTDHNRPLCAIITRLTDQKNIAAITQSAGFILESGGCVIVAGPMDQSMTADKLQALVGLEERFPASFRFSPEFIDQRTRKRILLAADFTIIPSRFEPFGLTDIEFSRYGAIVVARRTGGLGKVRHGLYYTWEDTTDIEGEMDTLKALIGQVMSKLRHQADDMRALSHRARKESFAWSTAFSEYRAIYCAIEAYKQLRYAQTRTASTSP